eukprot:46718-Eustigmatos_ZCMA.PRE.1
MILVLASSKDHGTRRAACSALGKLARPVRDAGHTWKKSAYQDRIVAGDGLMLLLDASRSEVADLSRCASDALRRL